MGGGEAVDQMLWGRRVIRKYWEKRERECWNLVGVGEG